MGEKTNASDSFLAFLCSLVRDSLPVAWSPDQLPDAHRFVTIREYLATLSTHLDIMPSELHGPKTLSLQAMLPNMIELMDSWTECFNETAIYFLDYGHLYLRQEKTDNERRSAGLPELCPGVDPTFAAYGVDTMPPKGRRAVPVAEYQAAYGLPFCYPSRPHLRQQDIEDDRRAKEGLPLLAPMRLKNKPIQKVVYDPEQSKYTA